jgi:ribosomal protein L21E
MAMNIKNKFSIGQPVYLVTDPEQIPGMVVHITITPIGLIYGVRFDCEVLEVYDNEISEDLNEVIKYGLSQPKEKN